MPAQKGRLLLLKVKITDTYTTVGSFRSNDLTINNTEVDVSDKDSDGMTELGETFGVTKLTASGNGLFKASAQEKAIEAAARNNTFLDCEIVVPGLGTYQADFHVGSYTVTGAHEGGVEASISLAASGTIGFTAAA